MEVLSFASETCIELKSSPLPLTPISLNHGTSLSSGREALYSALSKTHRRRSNTYSFAPLTPITAARPFTPSTSVSSFHDLPGENEETENTSESVPNVHSGFEQACMLQMTSPATGVPLPTWTTTPATPTRALCAIETPPEFQPSPQGVPASASYPETMFSSRSTLSYHQRRASAPAVSFSQILQLKAMQNVPLSFGIPLTRSPSRILTSTPPLEASEETTDATSSMSGWKPIFHIPHDLSDNEDEGPHVNSAGTDRSGASVHSLEEIKTCKDDVRRFHVLTELLTTEVRYLLDLRVLITIYFQHLSPLTSISSSPSSPSAPTSSRSSPSPFISSINRTTLHSYTSARASQTTASTERPCSAPSPSREKKARHMVSEAQFKTVTRNAGEILQLHEHFVDELRVAMSQLGFPMTGDKVDHSENKTTFPSAECIDDAIRVVSTKFAVEASRFNAYQIFCATHAEAVLLLQKIRRQHPSEWEAFEQRSSAMVLDLLQPIHHELADSPSILSQKQPAETSSALPTHAALWQATGDGKTRRRSLSTLDVVDPIPNAMLPAAATRKPNGSRLYFMDYLIKPVQRICKYPLLLDQLKGKTPDTCNSQTESTWPSLDGSHVCGGRPDVNVIVESASQAMRHVASLVDEAGRRQTVSMQSSLIISRIHLAWASSHSSSVHRPFHLLTPNFVTSLGACVLAGALDILHYHPSKTPASNTKTRYFGAFLYMGGYLILVKVLKNKVYEPQHWFSLTGFDLINLQDEEAKLPCSFQLSTNGHHFILGTSCQREKQAWLSAIKESLSVSPTWTNEPRSSLTFDGKGDIVNAAPERISLDRSSPLPTIQSIPDLDENANDDTVTQEQIRLEFADAHTGHGLSPSPFTPSSRRSSTTSVKSLFAPLSLESSNIVRRPSHATRLQVDLGLDDVISEPCRMARHYATTHDIELFYGVKQAPSSFGRSNSVRTLSKLSRNQSLLGSRKKATELFAVSADSTSSVRMSTVHPKALSLRKRRKDLSLLMPITSYSEGDDNASESPDPASRRSSSVASTPLCSSPTGDVAAAPAATTPPPTEGPKRTRSMVDNVRDLFYLRSTSSYSSMAEVSPPTNPCAAVFPALTSGAPHNGSADSIAATTTAKWWSKGSLRRRSRSSPDVVVGDTHQPVLPPAAPATTTATATIAATTLLGVVEEDLAASETGNEVPPQKSHRNFPLSRRFSLFTDSGIHP